MIEVTSLSFRYLASERYALRDLSFACDSSGITVAVGRSGIGKSTLIALMAGIFLPTDKLVAEFDGSISINKLTPDRLRGPRVVSWVPQAPLLLDHLSVLENIILPMSITGAGDTSLRESRAEAKRLLKKMDLAGIESYRPRELSGGMMTRVSLLRALISRPRYLFLDEPFKGLDLVNRWTIYESIRDLRGNGGLTTFLTTHDIPEATVMADRILLIQDQTDRTVARTIPNNPIPLGAYRDGEGLEKARAAAAPIEHLLFAHTSPEDLGTPSRLSRAQTGG